MVSISPNGFLGSSLTSEQVYDDLNMGNEYEGGKHSMVARLNECFRLVMQRSDVGYRWAQ